ncbi:MAG: recombinase family protein [Clostridium sp.]
MDKICIYLRKSRADEELEKTLGQGETLSKHRKSLLKFAKDNKLNIVEVKEEIVSGESLFFRPKMLELLKEIENKEYTGVLVMDMQRLGRGDMKDQGVILETFKNSNTKIITPMKTYDLNNDFDEEYSEFEAFMSRKELKMINRRMQGGRTRSIEDGNYISPNPPYGYDIGFINKSRVLVTNDIESDIVRLIFSMYIKGNGSGAIAQHLNSLGCKTKFGNDFERSSVIFILKNYVYIGKITWKKKEIKKSKNPGKVKDTRTRSKEEWIIADGKHKPIIDINTWNKAQEILKNKYHVPYQITNGPSNPLAGVLICGKCHSKIVGRPIKNGYRLICRNNKCDNVSSNFKDVEYNIIEALDEYLREYNINISLDNKISDTKLYEKQITILEKELHTLNDQKLKLFDFLERGVYTEIVFLERNKNIDARIRIASNGIQKLNGVIEKECKKTKKQDVIKFKKLLDAYKKTDDITLKNKLIKSLVHEIKYTKTKPGKDFQLSLSHRLLP